MKKMEEINCGISWNCRLCWTDRKSGYGTGKGRFCKGCIADTDSI